MYDSIFNFWNQEESATTSRSIAGSIWYIVIFDLSQHEYFVLKNDSLFSVYPFCMTKFTFMCRSSSSWNTAQSVLITLIAYVKSFFTVFAIIS